MNILFLIFHGLSKVSGISKKIEDQIEGLKMNGHQVELCHYEVRPDQHRVRLIDDRLLEDYGTGKLAPIRKRMCYQSIIRYVKKNNIQLVYVRSFHNASPFTIRLFRQMKKTGAQIIMEIPTFPYDQEYSQQPFSWRAALLVDKCFRHRLAQTSDAIVTFSDAPVIFGQKTIQISNGICFERLPLKTPHVASGQEFRIIAVAEVHYWHGYDRIIEGLGLYYQTNPTRKVFLDLVGGIGEAEMSVFKTLIQKYRIAPFIILHGQKQGKELDLLFDQADFAIGSLGRHRSGIHKIKTLKNREYAGRGIPFIYSETDDDFEQMPYILKAPADDSPVCVENILNFYSQLKITPTEIRHSVRHLAWDKQMQKVISAITGTR